MARCSLSSIIAVTACRMVEGDGEVLAVVAEVSIAVAVAVD